MDIREILHWLVNAVSSPSYEGVNEATPGEVHAAIDEAHGVKPEVQTAEDVAAGEVAAAQARLDALRAAAKAEVDQAPAV